LGLSDHGACGYPQAGIANGAALPNKQNVVPITNRARYQIESQSGTICDMSTQIAVRLPDDLVEFVDDLVRHGDAPSRAAVVARALRRERRQAAAARDAEILARTGLDADLDSLAEHAAAIPLDDLD
jgi:Arc/MetJ-type ribon-helix-helix transcriptional regulator